MNYKEKALKYKLKYLNLLSKIKQLGGNMPIWYDEFEQELYYINNQIKNVRPDVVLTGSGAIVFILKQLDMFEEINSLGKPNDLDFIYQEKINYVNNNSFGNNNEFVKKQSLSLIGSVTYNLENSDVSNKVIKSFDLSRVPRIKFCTINGINIINLKELIEYYKDDLDTDKEEINLLKINIINKIIKKITDNDLLEQYCLDKKEDEYTYPNKKSKSMFGSDSDDEFVLRGNLFD